MDKRFKVRFPNGLVIYSTWYKHPWMGATGRIKSPVVPWPDMALNQEFAGRSKADIQWCMYLKAMGPEWEQAKKHKWLPQYKQAA